MQSGAEQLRDWMTRRGFNQVETSVFFGFHESFVSLLLSGTRMPSLDNAVKIERLTGIPVVAWASSAGDSPELVGISSATKPKRHKR